MLTEDLPELGLKRGYAGTIVLVHRNEAGYEVEFVDAEGDTIDIVTLFPAQVRPVPEETSVRRAVAG
jgi:hypothetical protein